MNDDLARSLELGRWVVERCSSRSIPWAYGTAFFHDGFPNRFDQNFLYTEKPLDGVSVETLAAEADRVLADFRHRKITIEREDEGARLAMGFGELGWNGDHNAVMALHRDPDKPGAADRVQEVSFDVMRAFNIEVGNRDPRLKDSEPGVSEMLADSRRVLADEVGARFFVVTAPDGEMVASGCELYLHGDLAQVESVDTLEEFRGAGLARACISRAIAEARDAGAEHIFIWADANDWPQKLYERIGFDIIGYTWAFTKWPQGESPTA